MAEAARPNRGQELLAICEDVAALCGQAFEAFETVPKDEKEALLLVLFARAVEHFHAVWKTSVAGLPSSSRVVARSLLEVSFYFHAILAEKVTPDDLVSEHTAWRQKLLNKLDNGQFTKEGRKGFELTDELRENILAMAAELGAEKLAVEEVARRAGMHEEYLVAFDLLSATVHVRKRDLPRQFVGAGERGRRALKAVPGQIDCMAVGVAGTNVIKMAVGVAKIRGADVHDEATKLLLRLAPFVSRDQSDHGHA